MKYTFIKLAEEVLEKSNEPLGYKEIWEAAKKYGLADKIITTGKTPWYSIGAQIYVDIRDNINSKFVKVSTRPTTFGLKTKDYNNIFSSENTNNIKLTQTYKEKDLHAVLVKYVDSNPHFNCLTKTINQSSITKNGKSHEKKANMWVYSDLIGVYFPFDDFSDTSLELMKHLNETPYKIYSFEMKTRIDFSNFKEYYFQAVSNSSWANEGYLVCDDLLDDPDLMDELRILNSAHGIGIILLNKFYPDQSEIIFNAKYNEKLDIYMLNKLIRQNKDVESVFKYVNDSCKIGKKFGGNIFDNVLSDEEYHEYALKHFNINV